MGSCGPGAFGRVISLFGVRVWVFFFFFPPLFFIGVWDMGLAVRAMFVAT
jgi:hypothetical protein